MLLLERLPFLLVPPVAVPPRSQAGPWSRALWGLLRWCNCRQQVGVQAFSWVSFHRELTSCKAGEMKWFPCPLASCSREEKTLGLNVWASLCGQRRQLQDPWEQAVVTTWWHAGMHRVIEQSTGGSGRRENLVSVSYPAPRVQHTCKSLSVLEVPISSFRCVWILPEGCRLLQERHYKQAEIAISPLGLTSLWPRLKIWKFQHLHLYLLFFFSLKEAAIKLWWVENKLIASAACLSIKCNGSHLRDDAKAGVEDWPCHFCTFSHHWGAVTDACCGARTSSATTSALFFVVFCCVFLQTFFQLYGCMRDTSLSSHAQLMRVFAWWSARYIRCYRQKCTG